MYRKFMEILKFISKELFGKGKGLDDICLDLERENINLLEAIKYLEGIESSHFIEDEEVDMIKLILVYLFIKKSELKIEDIYALVFNEGRRFLWH